MRTAFLTAFIVLASCTSLKRDNPFDPNGENYDPRAVMPAPEGFHVIGSGFDYVDLQWSAVPNAVMYEITRYDNPDGPALKQYTSNVAGFIDHEVLPDNVYYYRVAARNADGIVSPQTGPVEVQTGPAPPLVLMFPEGGESFLVGKAVTIRWKIYDQGINAVVLRYSKDNGASFSSLFPDPIGKPQETFDWTPEIAHIGDACRLEVQMAANPDTRSRSGIFSVRQ